MDNRSRTATLIVGLTLVGLVCVQAETRKEMRFKVGHHATVCITNQYGPISVHPAAGREVVVNAVLASDKVEIDQSQRGSRVDLFSHLLKDADTTSGKVSYEVTVPADASIVLRSTAGELKAEKMNGDVNFEEATGDVYLSDLNGAHVHIKTLDGPVTLTNIQDGYVEITSMGGDVTMNAVSGPMVEVNSVSGKIVYDGDFGAGGEYVLTSHTGDIEAQAPSYASIDVFARSVTGPVVNDFTLEPEHTPYALKVGSAFAGTVNKAASKVKLLSFSGKIHLKKR
jgi:DUF4097 and DUF4098 domain-containing protein YvlB